MTTTRIVIPKRQTILRREDGTRVSIDVELKQAPCARLGWHHYTVCVTTCAKGRRTWQPVYDENSHIFRGLPFGGQEREDYIRKKQLEVVTGAEIIGAGLALWEQMKP
jgi:hypothetical protein